MAPNRRTTARRGERKLHKNERSHRRCPHCGQMQPGKDRKDAPHKPGGLKNRRAKQQGPDSPVPEPIDAKTIIQGVVERIPAALEDTTVGGDVPANGLNVAVRKAVLDEFRTRAQFAGRLAEIDALLWAQSDHGGELVSGTLLDHLRQMRILRVTEPEEGDRFVVTEGEGDGLEVLRPAYVDELTGKVVMAGHLRRVSARTGAEGEEK